VQYVQRAAAEAAIAKMQGGDIGGCKVRIIWKQVPRLSSVNQYASPQTISIDQNKQTHQQVRLSWGRSSPSRGGRGEGGVGAPLGRGGPAYSGPGGYGGGAGPTSGYYPAHQVRRKTLNAAAAAAAAAAVRFALE
jgi:hypothetical protein